MIPANIDPINILLDLNSWSWPDSKIEIACGFSIGYVAQLKCGNIKDMSYVRAARLFNFWCSEHELYTLQTHAQVTANSTAPISLGHGASNRL